MVLIYTGGLLLGFLSSCLQFSLSTFNFILNALDRLEVFDCLDVELFLQH